MKDNFITIQFGNDRDATLITYDELGDVMYCMNKNCEFWNVPEEYKKEIKAFFIKYKTINSILNNLGEERDILIEGGHNNV